MTEFGDPCDRTDRDDEPGWLSVFVANRQALLAFLARKAGPRHQPVDLLHDVYVRMSLASREKPIDNPRAYLFRAAANIAIDVARADRHRAREVAVSDLAFLNAEDTAPNALQTAIDRQRLRRLDRALAELPEEVRAMVYLLRVEGIGFQEAADLFGVSKSTVEKRVAKALKHCRDRLSADDE